MTTNLYDLIAARMPADRSACALETHDGQYWRWRDLEQASARIANLLASLQLPAQSRIAVQVDKSPEALCLYLATLRAGHVFLPLNTAYQKGEIAYFIEDAEPAVVVCMPARLADVSAIAAGLGSAHVFTLSDDGSGSLIDAAAPHADEFATVACEPSSLAAVLYTSGTTGRSKGAMLSHGNLASNALTLHTFWRWRQDDVLLHALPIFHVHGLFVAIHGALLSGSKMIWLPRFDPKEVVRHLPASTVFMGVPTMYVRLLDEPAFDNTAAAGMRLFISGSAPLLAETFRQFESRTGQRILERYGMSETVMLTSNPYEGHRAAGTVGLPLPDVAVRVVDDAGKPCASDQVGGVEVRGPNVFGGYWRMPDKTREEFTADGWFKTGDVGRFDAEGYLTIVGRSKDLIISGGYNVYPKEVESYLDDMPGVAESAVIGVPDRDFGEAVTAVVVAQAGAQLDATAMIATLKSLIASYKVPKRIHIVGELPRNAMGKVQKNELRKIYSN